jgi:hypothetical protein
MKNTLTFFFIFIITISFVSASIETQREFYSNQETLIATIDTDNFQTSKIILKDNSSNIIDMGFLSYQTETNNKIYFDIPIEFEKGSYQLFYETDSTTFEIIEPESSVSIDPVFIKPKNLNSKIAIELENHNSNPITVEIISSNDDIVPIRSSIDIPGLEKRSLFINLNNPQESSTISLIYDEKEYTIDIIILKETLTEEIISKENGLEFIETTPIVHLITNQQTIQGPLEFRNTLNTIIKGVSFHLTPLLANVIDFRNQSYPSLNPHSTYEQFIWINKNKRARPGKYNGTLLIQSKEGDRASLEIDITIIEEIIEETPEVITEEIVEEPQTIETTEEPNLEITEVSNLNGTFLGDIKVVDSKTEEEGSKNILLGIIILVIILSIAGIILWKLRPQEKNLKFNEYVHPLKKGNKKN